MSDRLSFSSMLVLTGSFKLWKGDKIDSIYPVLRRGRIMELRFSMSFATPHLCSPEGSHYLVW